MGIMVTFGLLRESSLIMSCTGNQSKKAVLSTLGIFCALKAPNILSLGPLKFMNFSKLIAQSVLQSILSSILHTLTGLQLNTCICNCFVCSNVYGVSYLC